MVKIIKLYPDMTFQEKNYKSEQDKIIFDKKTNETANFKLGKSMFRERRSFLDKLKFWKRTRSLCIHLDGCPEVLSLEERNEIEGEGTKPALYFNFGTRKDTATFIYKLGAKSMVDIKPISNTMFLILCILIGVVIVFQFLLMRGVKI